MNSNETNYTNCFNKKGEIDSGMNYKRSVTRRNI